jgi:hypothetical protein
VPTREEKRAYLDGWVGKGNADTMSRDHPNCRCEDAAPSSGGHGPVEDAERLRFFVTSRTDIDLKRRPNKPITPAILSRMFEQGKSSYRLEKAGREELEFGASLLYEYFSEKEGENGGILGVVDFAAELVRCTEEGARACCVFDTPIHPERPSHADIVYAAGKPEDEEDRRKARDAVFNRIGGTSAFVKSADVTDCNLLRYLPAKLREQS